MRLFFILAIAMGAFAFAAALRGDGTSTITLLIGGALSWALAEWQLYRSSR